jgi:hypothetical protein
MRRKKFSLLAALAVSFASCILTSNDASARLYKFYVTGEDAGADVIFQVTLNPAIVGGVTAVNPIITDPAHRLDGIDFVPGSGFTKLVVGAQSPGAITHYDLGTKLPILPEIVPSTGLAAAGTMGSPFTRPSTVLSTPSHIYYIENQFGFESPPSADHRIMRVLAGGGPVGVVFDGALAAGTPLGAPLVNLEGLEIVGSRLYFFAADHTAPAASRGLYSIGLAGGVWDSAAPKLHLGGLTAMVPPGDGSDELDYDPTLNLIFGSNIISGEIIAQTPGLAAPPGVFVVPPFGDPFLTGGAIDGIRTTQDGKFLVMTGLAGVIASYDLTTGTVIPLYDSGVAGTGYSFDDLTPLVLIPEPSSFALAALAVGSVLFFARRRRRRI